MPNFRAWVKILCNREGGGFTATVAKLATLRGSVPLTSAQICKHMSVYGDPDVIMIVEADTLLDIHRAISYISQAAKSGDKNGIFYTQTYIAAQPDASRATYREDGQICIGFCTLPGLQEETQKTLLQLDDCDLVDVTIGEFDLIALFHRQQKIQDTLRDALCKCPHIRATLPLSYRFS